MFNASSWDSAMATLPTFLNRDLSWLSFNQRVLQEAADPDVPLYERLRFLAIFSNNLDEFFRVRVASIQALLNLKHGGAKALGDKPTKLLRRIHNVVDRQQEEFGAIFRDTLLPALAEQGITFRHPDNLTDEERTATQIYFQQEVFPHIQILPIDGETPPFLHNKGLYLAVQLVESNQPDAPLFPCHFMVSIPSPPLPRFVTLPSADRESSPFIFLDDIVRLGFPQLFPNQQVIGAWSVKLTRDAELHIDDEFEGDLVEKIRKGLRRRTTGDPARFLFDREMPKSVRQTLRQRLQLGKEEMIRGGRYHNFNDFFSLPNPIGSQLEYQLLPPLPVPALDRADAIYDAISQGDHILHLPYHSCHYVVRFLQEAAADPNTQAIFITLYRVASNSGVVAALIAAAKSGKRVEVFVEIKARFDEEANLRWAEELTEAGARVMYSIPGMKVHSKLLLAERMEGETIRRYAYLSSGNFNEKTARVYTDHGLFTAATEITEEVRQVFAFLMGQEPQPQFRRLLVAPFTMQRRFTELVDREITAVKQGREGRIVLKLNSLEEQSMIQKLYEAAVAGVQIDLIVRGICCLNPSLPELCGRIRVISIVDRFLEHARVYLFGVGTQQVQYVGSADWMTRNLHRRIEVAFPIDDEAIRQQLLAIIGLQLRDNVKARSLDGNSNNRYVRNGDIALRSQMEVYAMLEKGKPPAGLQ